ncbi:hypothetical protein ABID97_003636 [Variovorax sp. OAS795]|uniref:hypothetical protein n=1 Tax=Variovorax sp. OAS795 TaxID=3034231 RepID=UPI003399FD5C
MKKRRLFLAVAACALALAAWNYFGVHRPVSERLAKDTRNEKVSLWAYHQYGVMPSVLVIDLRKVDADAATLDVMRALFQSAESHKSKRFERVVLAYRGSPKFYLDGAFYEQLGKEFGDQNPVYTIRTFPQNLRKLDGTAAYETWTGGMLGVLSKQMEDVNQFAKDWFIADLATTAGDR